MLTSEDWARMAVDLAEVRADNQVSIVIRRGNTTLAAQSARIAQAGSGGKMDSGSAEEARGKVIVCGATTLDIAVGDRFNAGGVLYRVTFVRSNRMAATVAEAEVAQ